MKYLIPFVGMALLVLAIVLTIVVPSLTSIIQVLEAI